MVRVSAGGLCPAALFAGDEKDPLRVLFVIGRDVVQGGSLTLTWIATLAVVSATNCSPAASGGAAGHPGGAGATPATDGAGGVGSDDGHGAAGSAAGRALAGGGTAGSAGLLATGGWPSATSMPLGGFSSGGSAGTGTSPGSSGGSGSLGSGGGAGTSMGMGASPGGRPGQGGLTASGGRAGGESGQAGGGAGGESGQAGGGAGGNGGTGQGGSACSGPIATFAGTLATGIAFTDQQGNPVNAHGGGIIKVGDTYYLHGEYFLGTTTDNNFNGFAMYSARDLASWQWEGMILPQQASGQLGPNRKGERPHIIQCPSTGEFVLYAHSADVTYQVDKEVVYATSPTVNGTYTFQGSLTNSSGVVAAHSDMSALTDGSSAYVVTESGHVYPLAADCHSWLSDNTYSAVNGDSGGSEAPTVFKAGSTYYWIGSYKTGWRANNNFYSTAPAMTGPWTYQGFIAPVTDTSTTTEPGAPDPPEQISDQRTWLSQTTWVTPVAGCRGTTYLFWGDHWDGDQDTTAPGEHNNLATYVFQPLVFTGTSIFMPSYLSSWQLDVGAGTWSE